MRVNVTYSVELQEVKQVIQEILLKVEGDVEEVRKNFLSAQQNINSDKEKEAVQAIDACRKSMASLDHSLFDCKNILNGYQQTLLQLNSGADEINNADENYDIEGG